MLECAGVDIQIQPSQTTEVILDITGAYVPLDSIKEATSAVAGEVVDVHEALPGGPGAGSYYDLLLDSGLHVSCDGAYMDTAACAAVEPGDRITAAGHVENFFGAVHVYAHGSLTVQ